MLDQYSQPEELLSDESFLNWYFKTGGEDDRQWEEWMNAGEGNKELARQAVTLLELTRLPERKLPDEQIDLAASRLFDAIDRRAANTTPVLPLNGRRRWIAAACCVGLLAAGGVTYLVSHSRHSVIRTEYGQLGQQVLPDGTEVTMNANSRLQLASRWERGADREVWVSGEAFFHVRHTPEKSRFIVHLNDCDVIVTGTQFNVVNRPGKENIMLEEGSVILHTAGGKEISMRPGDFVAVKGDQAEPAAVRADSLLAWRNRTVFLDSTPLRELVNIVYDQYGVRIHLAGDSTGSKTITAILPNNNLEKLLKGLEMTREFEVTRQDGGEITIAAHQTQK
jgi:ferric-dicitrate binding protein FerR (iron transport regulator)